MTERILRYKDIASLLGIKPATVRKYRWMGRIPVETIHGMPGMLESSFNAWLRSGVKP